jgi:flagellar biosynthesis/type III secretory pathway protein FliH
MRDTRPAAVTTSVAVEKYRPENLEKFLTLIPSNDRNRAVERLTALHERVEARKKGRPAAWAEGYEEGWVKGFAEGWAEGREESRRDGHRGGMVEAMMAIWPARFGAPASDEVRARLEQADAATLTRWLVQAQTARGPADVFAEP